MQGRGLPGRNSQPVLTMRSPEKHGFDRLSGWKVGMGRPQQTGPSWPPPWTSPGPRLLPSNMKIISAAPTGSKGNHSLSGNRKGRIALAAF